MAFSWPHHQMNRCGSCLRGPGGQSSWPVLGLLRVRKGTAFDVPVVEAALPQPQSLLTARAEVLGPASSAKEADALVGRKKVI